MKLTGTLTGDDGKTYPVSIEVGVSEDEYGPIGTAVSAKVSPAGGARYDLSALVTPTDAVGDMYFDYTAVDGAEYLITSSRVVLVDGVGTTYFVASSSTDVVAQAHFIPVDQSKYARSSSQKLTIPAHRPAPAEYVVPIGTNTVTINGRAFPLSGVNPTNSDYPAGRGRNELVIYTKGVDGKTATNVFGWEVKVGADGEIIGDGQVNRTEIPAGGYVLSGHNEAGDFLKKNSLDGDEVTLSVVAVPAVPEADVTKLPEWVVAGYWQQYEGPALSTLMVEAPQYNLLWCAFALGNGGQNMTFQPYVQNDASFVADLKEYRAKGGITGISIGGGVTVDKQGRDQRTYIRNKAEAMKVFTSLRPIITKYGFQGVDDDLENGTKEGQGFTYEGLHELFRLLREEYGPDFVLASTPRPYETFRVDYAAKLYEAGLLDLLQWQFYDSPEYRNVPYLTKRIDDDTLMAALKGIPRENQIVGCITRNGYPFGWNTIAAYENAIKTQKAKGLRGAFIWETNMDRAEKWSFAKRISALKD